MQLSTMKCPDCHSPMELTQVIDPARLITARIHNQYPVQVRCTVCAHFKNHVLTIPDFGSIRNPMLFLFSRYWDQLPKVFYEDFVLKAHIGYNHPGGARNAALRSLHHIGTKMEEFKMASVVSIKGSEPMTLNVGPLGFIVATKCP